MMAGERDRDTEVRGFRGSGAAVWSPKGCSRRCGWGRDVQTRGPAITATPRPRTVHAAQGAHPPSWDLWAGRGCRPDGLEVLPAGRHGTAGRRDRVHHHRLLCPPRAFIAFPGITRIVRVITDNGANYRAHAFTPAVTSLAFLHQRARPHTPRRTGKVERYQHILAEELVRFCSGDLMPRMSE